MDILLVCSPQKHKSEQAEKMIIMMGFHMGMSKVAMFFYALIWLLSEIPRAVLRMSGILSLSNGKTETDWSSIRAEPGLPVCRFEELQSREMAEESSCSICLTAFEGDDVVSELGRCRHVFHMDCIEKWVEKSHFTCPLCRAFFFDVETWQPNWGLTLPDSPSSLYYFLQ